MTVIHDPVLVLLSIGVAMLGSLTALALTAGGYDRAFGAWRTGFALANSGLIMGSTIWSSAARLAAIPAGESPANRGVQSLL